MQTITSNIYTIIFALLKNYISTISVKILLLAFTDNDIHVMVECLTRDRGVTG